MNTWIRLMTSILTVSMATTLVVVSTTPARAISNEQQRPTPLIAAAQGADTTMSLSARQEFRDSGIAPTFDTVNGVATETYSLEGMKFTFPVNDITSRVGGGVDPANGLFVSFSYEDQQLILRGGGAVLSAAICLQPIVGWAACALVVTVINSAADKLIANGLCGKGKELRVYLQLLGYPQCQ